MLKWYSIFNNPVIWKVWTTTFWPNQENHFNENCFPVDMGHTVNYIMLKVRWVMLTEAVPMCLAPLQVFINTKSVVDLQPSVSNRFGHQTECSTRIESRSLLSATYPAILKTLAHLQLHPSSAKIVHGRTTPTSSSKTWFIVWCLLHQTFAGPLSAVWSPFNHRVGTCNTNHSAQS